MLRLRAAGRTLASVVVALFGLLALTFFMGRMLPVDPVVSIIGQTADQATYDMVRHQLGFDRPLTTQFALYVRNMLQGDFGDALFTGHPVASDLATAAPATLELATLAILIATLVGVPLGIAAAVHRDRPLDHAARLIGLLGHSSPTFWLGLLGLVVFYAMLGWVGGPGEVDVEYLGMVTPHTGMLLVDALLDGQYDVFWNAVDHILLPGSILAFGAMAYISRMTRSFMLEQLGQEYVLTARAKGLGLWRVIWRHAFRNTLVQLVTVVALSYAFLLEGAVLIETVFSWPGLGHYLTSGLLAGDMNAVLACVLLIGVVLIGLNLIADLLYRLLDPRTR
jgi:peptide/nickel transport system permease protein